MTRLPMLTHLPCCRSKSDRSLGKPKKGGAGGKFNWGASLEMEVTADNKDPHDPNYDSAEELQEHLPSHNSRSQPVKSRQVSLHRIEPENEHCARALSN